MQKKNAGIARNFALKGLLLLAALTLSTGFFACKVAVGGGEGGKIESYTITYVNVEGATNENPASYNVETETITLKDPVKTGYAFDGWYKTEDFTGEAVTEITQGSTGNITLYAKWILLPEMVLVAGGTAPLGESGTKVTLSDFYIGKYEVTFEEYESIMVGNKNDIDIYGPYESKREPAWTDQWEYTIVYCNRLSISQGLEPCYTVNGSTNPDDWGGYSYPEWNVVCDFDANGYRLPTEAEWEYAARGGQPGITAGSWNNTYSGSNIIDDVACYSENCTNFDEYGEHYPEEVGLKNANALGLYDMSGNAMEWCWDWDKEIFPYTGTGSGEIKDPTGPESGAERVIRGGCSGAEKEQCTVSYRDYHGNSIYEANGANYGFRVVRSIR